MILPRASTYLKKKSGTVPGCSLCTSALPYPWVGFLGQLRPMIPWCGCHMAALCKNRSVGWGLLVPWNIVLVTGPDSAMWRGSEGQMLYEVQVKGCIQTLNATSTRGCQDTSDPRHFGTIVIVPKCPDISTHWDTLALRHFVLVVHKNKATYTLYDVYINRVFSVNKRFQCRAIPQFFVVIRVYIYSHESSLLLLMSS